jgi:hypothetical protein
MRITLLVLLVIVWCSATIASDTPETDCGCPASIPPGNHVLLICPQGDGPTLEEIGAVITLTYTDLMYPQYAHSPGGCNGGILWCGDFPLSDSLTGENMQTTVSGSFAGGGYDTELRWLIYQFYLPPCWEQYVPLVLVSPDINADLAVDIVDLSIFAAGFPSSSKPYDPRLDFDGDGTVGLVDLYYFSVHWQHRCM